MAFEMQLEVDGRLAEDQAQCIMRTCGFTDFSVADRGFDAYHPASGMNVCFRVDAAAHAPVAEGLLPPLWKRHASMTFRYSRGAYMACEAALMTCVRALADGSPASFVLAFQYESVYAIKDENGYREITDPPSTMHTPV